MTLNNFRQSYHKMITDKVITIPTIDTIIKHKEKKCYLSGKLVVVILIVVFTLASISNNSLDYGYHQLISNHFSNNVYGGSESSFLGLNGDQLYYAKGNYLGSEYKSTIITSFNIKNGKYQTIIETKQNKILMLNEYLIYQDNDKSITMFNTLDKTESTITYACQINDLKVISKNLIVTCNNDYSLIDVYKNLDKAPQQYQLNVLIDSVIYYDDTKLIYALDNQLGIYDLNTHMYQSLTAKIQTLMHDYIDKLVIYDDRLLFSLDNANGKLYSFDLNTSALRLVTDMFTNKQISSLIVNNDELYIIVFDEDSYVYRLYKAGQIEHLKTIDNDRIWSIYFDNENYLLELDKGYYLGGINKLSQSHFLP